MNEKIIIDDTLCSLCGVCSTACPFGAIALSEDKVVIDFSACTLCGACIDSCPCGAIARSEASQNAPQIPDSSGVWVWGEIEPCGRLSPVVFELLNIGRKLAGKRRCELGLVIVGHNIAHLAEEAIARGADRVFLIDSPRFEQFIEENHAEAIAFAVNKYSPEILLGGSTLSGRRLMPRLAVRLKTGLTADCTDLDIDDATGLLLQTRPAFGGNIMATIACPNHRPQMASVRHKVFPEAPADSSRKGEIVTIDSGEIAINTLAKAIIERIDESAECEMPITEADIIVAGGRGVGGAEGFELLRELASLLGGTIAASRAAVDAGWVPYNRQVGQTGRTVAPKLYIACGISGAIQHKVGMQTSEFIVAINKDKSAPIFDIANIGIVGDLFEVVPSLIRELST